MHKKICIIRSTSLANINNPEVAAHIVQAVRAQELALLAAPPLTTLVNTIAAKQTPVVQRLSNKNGHFHSFMSENARRYWCIYFFSGAAVDAGVAPAAVPNNLLISIKLPS